MIIRGTESGPAPAQGGGMGLDEYVTLGRSGLKVSRYCLGAMTFGQEWGFGADEVTSHRILDQFLERGGNFIDTANVYTLGTSERIIGNYIARDARKRDRLVIATKFSASLHRGDPNAGGGSRKAIIAACEESLSRLRTDYIDLYWMHWYDSHTPIDETLRALDHLVSSGKVRYLGFSDTPAWKVAQAQVMADLRGWTPLIALQIEYSLLERTVENELLPMARELGLGVTPWSPLRGGLLSGKYTRESLKAEPVGRQALIDTSNERTFDVVDAVGAIARKHGTTPARVALSWVGSRAGVTAPILGARTPEQLDDNLQALGLMLEPADIEQLDAVSAPPAAFPGPLLTLLRTVSYGGLSVDGRRYGLNPMLDGGRQ